MIATAVGRRGIGAESVPGMRIDLFALRFRVGFPVTFSFIGDGVGDGVKYGVD